jgi:hypothetical protein
MGNTQVRHLRELGQTDPKDSRTTQKNIQNIQSLAKWLCPF